MQAVWLKSGLAGQERLPCIGASGCLLSWHRHQFIPQQANRIVGRPRANEAMLSLEFVSPCQCRRPSRRGGSLSAERLGTAAQYCHYLVMHHLSTELGTANNRRTMSPLAPSVLTAEYGRGVKRNEDRNGTRRFPECFLICPGSLSRQTVAGARSLNTRKGGS